MASRHYRGKPKIPSIGFDYVQSQAEPSFSFSDTGSLLTAAYFHRCCLRFVTSVPFNFTLHNPGEEEVQTSSRVQILDTGDLLIAAVRETDAGEYTCIRSNEAGEVRGSARLGVLVRTQIIQPPADARVLLGHTATLQCKVSSDQAVDYTLEWFRDKQIISRTGNQRTKVLKDGTLEIQAVRASDVGQYTCSVTSAGGNETRSAKLSVIELPFAPTNVKAERVDSGGQRAVNVSWTPGFDGNSPVNQYIVQKREVPDFGKVS
ncbi:hypothetical protein GWI33_010711 [Rhynchophorus ferrugineus]|uniref:Uncharacterized protein n=1 Tax=Rhynchophorus ferrugineus TaxID=354439 RepID=A0A834IC31_RHYFE|nr:hypothetical protein GWI33_010711 [Rhynchophorus ferrugineus]